MLKASATAQSGPVECRWSPGGNDGFGGSSDSTDTGSLDSKGVRGIRATSLCYSVEEGSVVEEILQCLTNLAAQCPLQLLMSKQACSNKSPEASARYWLPGFVHSRLPGT